MTDALLFIFYTLKIIRVRLNLYSRQKHNEFDRPRTFLFSLSLSPSLICIYASTALYLFQLIFFLSMNRVYESTQYCIAIDCISNTCQKLTLE
jgi:hypothetical protein